MITDKLERLGSWSLTIDPGMPAEVYRQLDFFGHVAVYPGTILDVVEQGDSLLLEAAYVGVLRARALSEEEQPAVVLSGSGLALWLGDEDNKGFVREVAFNPVGEDFDVLVFLLMLASVPGLSSGTLYPQPGTYTGVHEYQTPRQILDYLAAFFDTHWRVNNDFTLDAGTAAELFVTDPEVVVVRRTALAGQELARRATAGQIAVGEDVSDWTSRVVVLSDETTPSGEAETASGSIPYRDPLGNPLRWTRLIQESQTSTGNGDARAQLHLNRFSSTRKSVRLSSADCSISGTVKPGDYVYVYDPDAGLFDTNTAIEHRGQLVHPLTLPCIGVTWPVTEGHTVAFRRGDGTWLDITRWVRFETGDVELEVGDYVRTLAPRKSVGGT